MERTLTTGIARPSIPRSIVIAACLLWLAVGSTARAAADSRDDNRSSVRFAVNAGRLLKLQRSGSAQSVAEVIEGRGQMSLSIDGAVVATDRHRDRGFVFDGAPGDERFALLGPYVAESRRSFGGPAQRVVEWRRIITYHVTAGADYVTATYRVGHDRLTVAIPRIVLATEWGEAADADVPPALVEVNGATAELDAVALTRSREVLPYLRAAYPRWRARELSWLFGNLDAPRRLVNGLEGLQQIDYMSGMQLLGGTTESCMGPCLSCAGSLVTVAGASAAIGLSCGGSVFTGGISLGICWTAIVTAPGTVMLAAANCSKCDHCISDSAVDPRPVPPACDPCDKTKPCQEPPPDTCPDDPDSPD
jgi:hypothetical protein